MLCKNMITFQEAKNLRDKGFGDSTLYYDIEDCFRIIKLENIRGSDNVAGWLDQLFGGNWDTLTYDLDFEYIQTFYDKHREKDLSESINSTDNAEVLNRNIMSSTKSSVFNKIITQKEARDYYLSNIGHYTNFNKLTRTIYVNCDNPKMFFISTNLNMGGGDLDNAFGGDWGPLSFYSTKSMMDYLGLAYINPEPKYDPKDVVFTDKSLFSNASPDAPISIQENGAKQSHTDLRFDLIPPEELATIAKILGQGAVKYGDYNWHGITTESNLNHAIQHIYAWLSGDRTDDHLGHAATRLMFAMWTSKNHNEKEH